MSANVLKFSVVICAYNSSEKLAQAIKSLRKLNYPKEQFEIIVIDDGSTDNTLRLAKRFKNIRIVSHEANLGIAAARNTGLKEAKGRWIAYIDDDCIADPSWLSELEVVLKKPNTLAAGGLITARSTKAITQRYLVASGYGRPAHIALGVATSPFGRFKAYVKDKFAALRLIPTDNITDVHEVYGANVAFPKTKLRSIKGFNLALNTSEDADVCARLHQEHPAKFVRFNPKALVQHSYTSSFSAYLKKLFKRQVDTLEYYSQQQKLPPVYPFPILILLILAIGAAVTWKLGLILLLVLPLLVYSWWTVEAFRKRKVEFVLFAYMEWIEETIRILGLLRAVGRRVLRKKESGAIPTSVVLSRLAAPQNNFDIVRKLNKKKLFIGLISWMAVFTLLELTSNPLQAIVAAISLLVIPGVLFLAIMQIPLRTLRAAVYSGIASLGLLMGTALVADAVVLLSGRHILLSSTLFVVVFDIIMAVLGITACYRTSDEIRVSIPKGILDNVAAICAFSLLPALGVFATFMLNNTGNNFMNMVVLGIAFVVMAIITLQFKKIPRRILPIALYSLSLTFVLMGALRGSGVSGTDISKEFYLFNLVQHLGYWSPSIYQDAYNSCISIHLFPVLLSEIIKIDGETVYRVLLPALYAFVPLIVYALYRQLSRSIVAFTGALFFIVQPVFMKWSAIPVRQMFGFLFFGSLILVLFDKELSKPKRYALVTLFGIAMVISHYSTAYIALGVLSLAFVILRSKYLYGKIIRKQKGKPVFLLTAPMLAILIVSAAIWYGPVTHTSGHALEIVQSVEKQVAKGNLNIFKANNDHSEQASFLDQFNIASAPRQPAQVWKSYLQQVEGKYKNLHVTPLQSKYAAAPITARAPSDVKLNTLPIVVHGVNLLGQVSSKLMRIFLAIGLLMFVYRFIWKRYSLQGEYEVFAISSAVAIVLVIVVPYASIDYDIGRTSQQLLILLALPTIIGGIAMCRFIFRKKISEEMIAVIIMGFVTASFLFVSNFLPQLTGGQQPSSLLDNYGVQSQINVHAGETAAADWLAANHDATSRIYSGYFGRNRLWVAGIAGSSLYNDILPWTIDKNAYVYMSYDEVQNNEGTTYYNGSFVNYDYPTKLLNERKNSIYSNGQARIYK